MLTTQPCLTCESIFTSKTKNVRFCGKSCATIYQHKNTPLKTRSIDCKRCGISVVLTRNQKGKLKTRSYCNICVKLVSHEKQGKNITPWNLRTKAEVFNGSGNWQSARTAIRRHAVQVFLDLKLEESNF